MKKPMPPNRECKTKLLLLCTVAFVCNLSAAINDGIPASWRIQYFGEANIASPQSAAIADPDGDGLINFQEYLAGTDPLNATNDLSQPRAIQTIAGSTPGDHDGPLSEATFYGPYQLRKDRQGRIWVTELVTTGFYSTTTGGHRLRIIDHDGTVRTVAGSAEPGYVDGPGLSARFSVPVDVVFDRHGNAFVSDNQNFKIRKIDTNGVVSTLAGSTKGYKDGSGSEAKFDLPWSLAIDDLDNIYVADFSNYRIRRVTPSGDVTTFHITEGAPNGLDRHPDGSLYYINWKRGQVRKIDSNKVDTVVLSGLGTVERMHLDDQGNLFVVHTGGKGRVFSKYNVSLELEWSLTSPLSTQDGPIEVAEFGIPSNPVRLPGGDLLFADPVFHLLRVIKVGPPVLLTLTPSSLAVTNETISVSMQTIVTNGIIRYTLDGSPPATNSLAYQNALIISESTLIRAAVFVNDYQVSLVSEVSLVVVNATNLPPAIALHPQSQSVMLGANVRFSLSASGTPPLLYQWYFNGEPLAGATNAVLEIPTASLAHHGNYQVVVANEFGAATSAVATLTVQLPPPRFIVQSGTAMAGTVAVVPILLAANGTENAMQFSLSFSTERLSLLRVELGAGLTNATFLTNLTQLASGRVGLALSLPANETMPAGMQEIARLVFQTMPRPTAATTSISFGGSPLAQQVANAQAQVLTAQYVNGTVTLLPTEYEGDVAPRGATDRQVTVIDWVQVGRFVAALDTAAPGLEFQRADCAPRAEGGNGILSASDWVQAGRYAAGLDPLVVVSGPTNYVEPEDPPPGLVRQALNAKAANGNACTVSVAGTTLILGQEISVPVVLHANGTESALTFSLQFNPAQLTFRGAQAVAPAGRTLTINQNATQVAQGRLGLALSLQAGQSFQAGEQTVVKVTFDVKPEARGPVTLNFASQPVAREVADVEARPLSSAVWTGRTLPLALPTPKVNATAEAGTLSFRWPANLSGVVLEATDDLAAPNWAPVNLPAQEIDGENQVAVPADQARKFYRLRTQP